MPGRMFDRYGRVTIARMITAFYADVLRAPRLEPYFRDVSVGMLVEHQTHFMTAVMGGPDSFTDTQIREAHHSLRVTREDFEEMLRMLEDTMRDFEIAPEDVAMVLDGYRRLQENVVNEEPVGS